MQWGVEGRAEQEGAQVDSAKCGAQHGAGSPDPKIRVKTKNSTNYHPGAQCFNFLKLL